MAHQTSATGIVPVGSVGQPATARPAGVAGSVESNYRGAEPGGGAGSRKAPRSTTTGDPSRCRFTYRNGIRADHRKSRTLPVWKAGRQLSRSGSTGGLQRESPTVGAYHQTGQLDVALLVGGGGAGHGTQSSGMAPPILSPDDAAGAKDCQGRHGPATGCLSLLDDAPGMGLPAMGRVRFARGTARKSPWCVVHIEHIEWAFRSSSPRSSN